MSNRVRVLRLLEYVGTPEWVNKCIEGRAVKGRRVISGDNFIQEAIIGETPELFIANKKCLTDEELSSLERLTADGAPWKPVDLALTVGGILKRIKGQGV